MIAGRVDWSCILNSSLLSLPTNDYAIVFESKYCSIFNSGLGMSTVMKVKVWSVEMHELRPSLVIPTTVAATPLRP
jgi:hypothetical protein